MIRSATFLVALLLLTPVFGQSRLVPVGTAQPGQPLAVVVHGINPEPGQLDALAEDVAARGYRTYLFHYDDDQRLEKSARELSAHLVVALAQHPSREVAIVAHSMGGLVSRRALTVEHGVLSARSERFTLITIASPFGGFASANWARMSPFGPGSHKDLGTRARYITRPGRLADNARHVKVQTREKNTLRRVGERSVDDDVVALKNQRQETIDEGALRVLTLPLGHVGSVLDDAGSAPLMTRFVLSRYLGSRLDGRAPAERAAPRREGAVSALRRAS